MKYTVEKSLSNFEFWSGAKYLADKLTPSEMDTIESILEDVTSGRDEPMSDTEINDLFWMEPDQIAEWLGYERADDLLCRDEFPYCLKRAAEFASEISDGMYVLEFDKDDVAPFLERNGMDMDKFLADGWKQYVAEISDCTVEYAEENDYFSDYEDTVEGLKIQQFIADASDYDSLSPERQGVIQSALVDFISEHSDELNIERATFAENIKDALDEFEISERDEEQER